MEVLRKVRAVTREGAAAFRLLDVGQGEYGELQEISCEEDVGGKEVEAVAPEQ